MEFHIANANFDPGLESLINPVELATCFLCGNKYDSQADCDPNEDGQDEDVKPDILDNNLACEPQPTPLHILLFSALKIDLTAADQILTAPELLNLCSKCSKDLISWHELLQETRRLELIVKQLNDGFIDSTIKSLIQFSCDCQNLKESDLLLKNAIAGLRNLPVQFNIYKKWRVRFKKTFNSLHPPLKSKDPPGFLENINLGDNNPSKLTEDLDITQNTLTLHSAFSETSTTLLFHDHDYGFTLNHVNSQSETEGDISHWENIRPTLNTEVTPTEKQNADDYQCQNCGKKFRRKAALGEHMKNGYCTQANNQNASGGGFSQDNEFKTPTKKTGNSRRNPAGQTLNASDNTDVVVVEEAEPLELPKPAGKDEARCTLCGKKFSSKRVLRQHMRTHTGERPFTCGVCKKSFLDRPQLKIHARIHTGEKPYICDQCGAGFTSLSGFHSHRKTHAKLKPFICQQCQAGFRSLGHLKKHELIHSGEKPFVCQTCNKTFNRRENLRTHEYTHKTVKPHQCSLCPQSFVRASYLATHVNNCHSLQSDEDLMSMYAPDDEADLSYEDQIEFIATFDPTTPNLPHLEISEAPASINLETISVLPEAVFIADNGEQYIIFN